jgi:HTH-type transcriptional regulator/antitoxin HigA
MATNPNPIRFAVPPGYFIREELEARGWSQETLAAKMRRPYQAVNAIINGHKTITADTAIELGDAFGTSAMYWMNLQTAYQLYKASQKKSIVAKNKQSIGRKAPSGGKVRRKADSVG